MVVGNTTINQGGAGKRGGGKGTRSTSKKKKQQEDSWESSEEETQAEASVTERTKRTLKAAELKATETLLKAREYLDSNQVKAITQNYGVTTRRELGLLTSSRACKDRRRNPHRGEQETSSITGKQNFVATHRD